MSIAGVNHLALVCSDMAETTRFYTQVLGMPLVKTVQLPDGGQHFFFDCGGGSSLAFFWWADGPPAAPGIRSTVTLTPSWTRWGSTPAAVAARCTNSSLRMIFWAVTWLVRGVGTGTPVFAVVTRPR